MLIRVPQQTQCDLDVWTLRERADAINAQRAKFRVRSRESIAEIARFAEAGPCCAGVSWGKDSTVLADLVSQLRRTGGPTIPLCWVLAEPRTNPHCALVRDAFFAMPEHAGHPYVEIVEHYHDGANRREGTLARGMARMAAQIGSDRYISGVRAAESTTRRIRMATHSAATDRTCAPIGWWSTADVWAYLHQRRLPVHPAYAMSLGTRLDRDRLRVGPLGGERNEHDERGGGHGRLEWERHYYGWRLREIEAGKNENPRTI